MKNEQKGNHETKNIKLLPKDTAKISPKHIDNFYLRFNKFMDAKRKIDNNKPPSYSIDKLKPNSIGKLISNFPESSEINNIDGFIQKQKYIINKFSSIGYQIEEYEFKPFNRIIIGLGSESVREVSMTLHWIYGIPYIPGQAIKGVVSDWIKSEIGDEVLKEGNFIQIFGSQKIKNIPAQRGNVLFLDSFPKNFNFNSHLKLDIMNPHYPDYYKENNSNVPPTDWQNPIPVFFLTVEKVNFDLTLIYLKKDLRNQKIYGKTLEEWMKEALKYNGIGAKTSLGYGSGILTKKGGGN